MIAHPYLVQTHLAVDVSYYNYAYKHNSRVKDIRSLLCWGCKFANPWVVKNDPPYSPLIGYYLLPLLFGRVRFRQEE